MNELSGFREKTVRCASIRGDASHRMAYREWGDPANPRVLICVHGLTRTGRDYDYLAAALAPDYRVVCPDVVGRGLSDRLAHPQDYNYPQYVADMLTLIARLDVEQVHWVGTSMGGRIGMAVAALPNSPVTRLVLNDIGPQMSREGIRHIISYIGEDPSFSSFDDAVAYVKAVSLGFGEHSDEEWRFLTEPCVQQGSDGRWHFRYDPAISPFYVPGKPGKTGTRRRLARQLIRFFPDTHPLLYQWPMYERITCPTLAMRGADSTLLGRDVWQQMGERGPRAQLVEIPRTGHAPTFLHDDNIRIVSDFLLAQ